MIKLIDKCFTSTSIPRTQIFYSKSLHVLILQAQLQATKQESSSYRRRSNLSGQMLFLRVVKRWFISKNSKINSSLVKRKQVVKNIQNTIWRERKRNCCLFRMKNNRPKIRLIWGRLLANQLKKMFLGHLKVQRIRNYQVQSLMLSKWTQKLQLQLMGVHLEVHLTEMWQTSICSIISYQEHKVQSGTQRQRMVRLELFHKWLVHLSLNQLSHLQI